MTLRFNKNYGFCCIGVSSMDMCLVSCCHLAEQSGQGGVLASD